MISSQLKLVKSLDKKTEEILHKLIAKMEDKEKFLQKFNLQLTNKHPDVASYLHSAGNAYCELGDFTQALKYYGQTLNICKAIHRGNHINTAVSLLSIGSAHYELGDLTQAIDYNKQALQMCEAIHKINHIDIVIFSNSSGNAYYKLNNFEQALKLYKKALQVYITINGNNLDTALLSNKVANTYYKLGDFDHALNYEKQALTTFKVFYGDIHPVVAETFHNIGNIYYKSGRFKEAIQYYTQALWTCMNLKPRNNETIAIFAHSMGNAYYGLNDFYHALQYYEQSLHMLKAARSNEHKGIANLLHNLSLVYKAFGYLEKESCYQQIKNDAKNFPAYKAMGADELAVLKTLLLTHTIIDIIETFDLTQIMYCGRPFDASNLFKAFFEDDYLSKQLGKINNAANLKIARMLCFEAINLTIFNNGFKEEHLAFAEKFAQIFPELLKEIATRHPQFFVDLKIVQHLEKYHDMTDKIMGIAAAESQKQAEPPSTSWTAKEIARRSSLKSEEESRTA